MTDSPEWRRWADVAHQATLQPSKPPKNRRYKCSDPSCPHKTTKNQAKKNGGLCFTCKSPLKGLN
jgi:hypothetical protein